MALVGIFAVATTVVVSNSCVVDVDVVDCSTVVEARLGMVDVVDCSCMLEVEDVERK